MRSVYLTIVLTLLGVSVLRSAAYRVTFISDIHHDPQYGTSLAFGKCTTNESSVWGVAGCDASPELTQRALDDVSAQNTSFVFYGGDWQRHGFSRSELAPNALFADLSARFRNVTVDGSLGEVAFITSLGNNDVVPDYYFAWDSDASVSQLGYRVAAMQAAGLLSEEEATVMGKCGSYTHETETVNIISLHTLLWAYRLEPTLDTNVSDPCNQFAFLRDELQKVVAAGKRAIIIGHIPPGLNVFPVLQRGFTTAEGDMYWKPAYQNTYDSIIMEYKAVIAVQLFGHTHRFSPLAFAPNGVMGFVLPAVSPVYNNHPSYMMVNFSDDGWVLDDLQIRYATSEGDFHAGEHVRAAMGFVNGFDIDAARASVEALATDDAVFENYLSLYGGGEYIPATLPLGACDATCRRVMMCSMLENAWEGIKACVAGSSSSTDAPTTDAPTTTTTTSTTAAPSSTSTSTTPAPTETASPSTTTTTTAVPRGNAAVGLRTVPRVVIALVALVAAVSM